jgi:ATP-dependent RNA helicase DeaD
MISEISTARFLVMTNGTMPTENGVADEAAIAAQMTTTATTDTETPSEPKPPSFDDLGLHPDVKLALDEMGYFTPTPVQTAVFGPVSEGKDLMVQSRTGTGKTTAFGLPIINKLVPTHRAPQALILAPTRELALQVSRELTLLGKHRGIVIEPIYGGAPIGKQITSLRNGVHIVVGTPGRILDHIGRRTLDLSTVQTFVLDECDEMLSMGFLEDIEKIASYLPEKRQTLLFSATMPDEVLRYSRRHMRAPENMSLSRDSISVSDIHHAYYIVSGIARSRDLLKILFAENPDSAIIFCNTRDETGMVARFLQKQGLDAEPLSSDLSQSDRERVMGRMKAHQLRFLCATDVAARGIDISKLSHVINYTVPEDPAVYVHRTGRTGRAGRKGTALSLVGPRELGQFRYVRLTYDIKPEERVLPKDDIFIGKLKVPLPPVGVPQPPDPIQILLRGVTGTPTDLERGIFEKVLAKSDGKRVLAMLVAERLNQLTTRSSGAPRRERPERDDRGERSFESRGEGRPERGDRGDRGGERGGEVRYERGERVGGERPAGDRPAGDRPGGEGREGGERGGERRFGEDRGGRFGRDRGERGDRPRFGEGRDRFGGEGRERGRFDRDRGDRGDRGERRFGGESERHAAPAAPGGVAPETAAPVAEVTAEGSTENREARPEGRDHREHRGEGRREYRGETRDLRGERDRGGRGEGRDQRDGRDARPEGRDARPEGREGPRPEGRDARPEGREGPRPEGGEGRESRGDNRDTQRFDRDGRERRDYRDRGDRDRDRNRGDRDRDRDRGDRRDRPAPAAVAPVQDATAPADIVEVTPEATPPADQGQRRDRHDTVIDVAATQQPSKVEDVARAALDRADKGKRRGSRSEPTAETREFWETWADAKATREPEASDATDEAASTDAEPAAREERKGGRDRDRGRGDKKGRERGREKRDTAVDEKSSRKKTDAAPAAAADGNQARLFISLGKKHGVSADDLRTLLAGPIGGDTSRIGSVSLRDSHAHVRVPEELVEAIISGVHGTTHNEHSVTVERSRT